MLEVKTNNGRTRIKANGSAAEIVADLGVTVSAVMESIMRAAGDACSDEICTAANLCLIRAVQNARERVKRHDE